MIRELRASEDFNQMLVTSVFIHFFLLLSLLFAPKPKLQPKVVMPAFMVDLAEIPGGLEEEVTKTDVVKKPSPQIKASKSDSQGKRFSTRPKAFPPSIKKEVSAPGAMAKLMRELEKIDGKPESKSVMEELDQLAQTKVIKKVTPRYKENAQKSKFIAKKALIKEASLQEKTRTLLKSESDRQSKLPEIKLPENLLEGLEDLNIKDEANPVEIVEHKVLKEVLPESIQYAKLEKVKKLEQVSKLDNDFESLINDLESLGRSDKALSTLDKANLAKSETDSMEQPQRIKPVEKKIFVDARDTFSEITRKIPSSGKHNAVEVEIVSSTAVPANQEFVSHIRTTKTQESSQSVKGNSVSKSLGQKGGSSDPLALYVGQIKSIIDSHWKIPLGIEHKEEILASFFLYSGGNIDKPHVKTSSGVEHLDAMAIKAILDSAPFPQFPEDLQTILDEPNLHITMHFKLTIGQ